MDECVFCKIVLGELPIFKTFEDPKFLGFLDIAPLAPGNSLLIPKDHHRWVTDVPDFGAYYEAARKVALASQKVVNSDYTTFLTLGTDVPHAHIRIVPRWYNDRHQEGISARNTVEVAKEEMVRIASEIYNNL